MDPTGNEKAFAVLAFGLIDDQALYDLVTGLPGPALLVDRVGVALARARRLRRRVGIYVLCDACAPSDDDAARRVARLLRSEVRPDDTVARITDRTFVVACNDLQYEMDVQRIAARLIRHADHASHIGIALGTPSDDARELLTRTARFATPRIPTPA
jgi:GGDEF domain-containing protein